MPFGILNIMKPNILSCNEAVQVERLVKKYFVHIQGEYHIEQKTVKTGKDHVETIEQKVWDRPPEPVTISGLALALGFNSRQQFEQYLHNGQFADVVKQAMLRVEAGYEANLHQNTTGAMFALKSMGWKEKPEPLPAGTETDNVLMVMVENTGPNTAGNEKDVTL
jgi:hypothetical protein